MTSALQIDLQLSYDRLPCSTNYELSYMHKDIVTHTITSPLTNVIATLSQDGIIKFWKKIPNNIELLRYFKCHTKPINSARLSANQNYFVTCSMDRTIKIFDLSICELVHFIDVDFVPSFACVFYNADKSLRVACLEENSKVIRIFIPTDSVIEQQFDTIHKKGVLCIDYCQSMKMFLSVDEGGLIEYWDLHGKFPSSSVLFSLKSQTDLYSVAKDKASPYSMSVSHNEQHVALLCNDYSLRIFDIRSGKCLRIIKETPWDVSEDAIASKIHRHEQQLSIGQLRTQNVVFDANDLFVIYANFTGIKICTVDPSSADTFDSVVGWDEKMRFLNVSLYQACPQRKLVTVEMAASDNPAFQANQQIDSCLFCTGSGTNRFYLITKSSPPTSLVSEKRTILSDRDIQNETITSTSDLSSPLQSLTLHSGKFTVLHTDMGDIKLELFTEFAPKATANFITHCKNGYFNRMIFHRVVRDFMIQSGDPNSDGTGGSSVWDKEFEDEFHTSLNFEKPFMLCMANSGPNTNASQWFITVVPSPWLYRKHTVFGKVVSGFETVLKISNVAVGKFSKPLVPVVIRDVEVKDE